MNSESYLKRVEEDPKGTYSKGEVKQILGAIQPEWRYFSVDKIKKGYVVNYRVTGGKVRPWVVLFVRKGLVGCATLTHSELEGGYHTDCPLWADSYIGPTLTTIPEERILDTVIGVYTNNRHLTEVLKNISKVWS